MTEDRIRALAAETAARCGTRDPFRAAAQQGITVLPRSDFARQKGAFTVVAGEPFIFINSRLSEETQRIVCAHELGHALLHRGEGQAVFMEFELFGAADRKEREANLFAAELLLDGEEISPLAREGMDAAQIARAMGVHVDLVLIKMDSMGGFRLPRVVRSRCLKTMTDDAGTL